MKYKVGDKVQIKSINWYYDNITNCIGFTESMKQYCGKIAIITKIRFNNSYNLDIDDNLFFWNDEMFEKNIKDMETKEITLPKGWEVDKIENGKIVLKESKKELPKTWKECCELVKEKECVTNNSFIRKIDFDIITDNEQNSLPKGLGKPMLALCQLLVCREIYRQGWKPDYNDECSKKYSIESNNEVITKNIHYTTSKVLSFQSPEITDEFLKNFRDLIEEAKELI